MRMSTINWKYIVTAAEELNFTRAAEKLFISQQSLSNYIVKLEASLGVELFNRGKTLTLTTAGESLYENAKRIVAMEELAERELQDIRDFKSSSLRIGITRSNGSKNLPIMLPRLKELYPDLKIELVEKRIRDLKQDLFDNKIDLMFGYEEDGEPDITYEIFHQEQTMLVLTESLWKKYVPEDRQEYILGLDKVPLEEFANCPFVFLKDGGWQNGRIKNYCNKKNVELNGIIVSESMETLVNLALVGYGATICPSIYTQDEFMCRISKEKVYKFVLDDPIFSPTRAIMYLKKRYLPKAALDFIEIAKQNPYF